MRDLGPAPTLGELHRSTPWVWLWCERCQHHAPLACAVAVILWGPDASSDTLRARARCTGCCGRGATLQRPGWAGTREVATKGGRPPTSCALPWVMSAPHNDFAALGPCLELRANRKCLPHPRNDAIDPFETLAPAQTPGRVDGFLPASAQLSAQRQIAKPCHLLTVVADDSGRSALPSIVRRGGCGAFSFPRYY
jgi:hypothetical protein